LKKKILNCNRKQIFWIILITLICFNTFFRISGIKDISKIQKTIATSNITLKTSYTTVLQPGESVDIGGYVENNQIQWNFECSETDVGIELWLLTLGEYINYTNNQPPYGWFIISDGTKHQDSGIFYTSSLNASIIFLIFTNRGLFPATLTFNVDFTSIYQEPIINPPFPPFFNLITFLIIIFAIITVSIIIVIYFSNTHKRAKKPSEKGIIEEKLIYPKPRKVKKEIESSQHIIKPIEHTKPLKSINDINYQIKSLERAQKTKPITQLIDKPSERKEDIEKIINLPTYCSFCGKKIVNDVKICSQCGSRI